MGERIQGAQLLLARMIEIINTRPQGDNPPFGLHVTGNAMISATEVSYPDEPARRMAVLMRDIDTLVNQGAVQRTRTADGWQLRINVHLLHH